jgi:hypothetical protein
LVRGLTVRGVFLRLRGWFDGFVDPVAYSC